MSSVRDISAMVLMWRLRRIAGYLGWLPTLFILVLLGVLAASLKQQSAIAAQLTQLAQNKAQITLSDSPQPTDMAIHTKAEVTAQSADDLVDLWQQLPAYSALSPRMMQIARMAHHRQIALNVGDYQWQIQSDSQAQNIKQFDMRFSIRADYSTCRQFIVDVLRQYPDMALTALDFHKNETVQPELDTTLIFSAFIREGHAHDR